MCLCIGGIKKNSSSFLGNIVIEIHGLMKTFFHLSSILNIYSIIKKFKINLVYTTSACIKSGGIAASFANVPHVWHIKERIGKEGFMKFRLNDNDLVKYIRKNSEVVFTMSHYIAEIFYKHSPSINLNIIPDGFDLKKNKTDKHGREIINDVKCNEKVNNNDVVFGLVSSLGSTIKRHDIFINAAIEILKTHNNIKFKIFGDIPKKPNYFKKDSYEKYISYVQLIKKLKLEDKIVFVGHVNDINRIMNDIDIMTHTCDKEGFGRVIIEAMAFSKPLIVPDNGGASEIVDNKYNGLHFKSGSYKSLVEQMNYFILNEHCRDDFGKKSYNIFKNKYSIKNHYNRIVESLNNIMEN